MSRIRVSVRCPSNLRDSGLLLYAEALICALGKSGRFSVVRLGWFDTGSSSPDVEVWCGVPRDIEQAEAVIADMATRHGQKLVLLPEWEAHSTADLVALAAPLAERRVFVVAMNNGSSAAELVRAYDNWIAGYIPTPLAADAFFPRSSRVAGSRLKALYVGRIGGRKRVDWLAETWNDASVADVSSLTICTPSDPSRLRAGSGVDVRVLDNLQVSMARFSWYDAHHIYVSASAIETGPISAIEAMARGCVPLLANSPGHRELAERSQACVLFDSLDELRSAAITLAKSPEVVRNLSVVGAAYVTSCHSGPQVADAFVELLGGGPC